MEATHEPEHAPGGKKRGGGGCVGCGASHSLTLKRAQLLCLGTDTVYSTGPVGPCGLSSWGSRALRE